MQASKLIVDAITDSNDNKLSGVDIMSISEYNALKKNRKEQYGSSGQVSERTTFDNFVMEDILGADHLFHTRQYGSFAPNISWLALGTDSNYTNVRKQFAYFNVNGRLHHFSNMGSNITTTLAGGQYIPILSTPGIAFPVPDLPRAETTGGALANAYKAGDLLNVTDQARELVSNGTFTTGIAGWGAWSNTATIKAIPGKLQCDLSTTSNLPYGGCWVPINSLKDQVDYVTFDLTSTNLTQFGIYPVYSAGNAYNPTIIPATDGTKKVNIIKNEGLLGLMFYGFTTTPTIAGTFTLDNVSVMSVPGEYNLVCLRDTVAGSGINDVFRSFSRVDSLSRQDFMFLESWEEDVSATGMVYPLGNVQYAGQNTDGLSTLTTGTFVGADTYSSYGNWDLPGCYVGKGYVWNTLTTAQMNTFASNPDNNIYKDGNTFYQSRYRTRVIKGMGNDFINIDSVNKDVSASAVLSNNSDNYLRSQGASLTVTDYGVDNDNLLYTGRGIYGDNGAYGYNHIQQCTPLALVQRRNAGIYHPAFNPHGASMVVSLGVAKYWHDVTTLTSTADCLNPDNIAVVDNTSTTPLTTAVPLTSLNNGTIVDPNFKQTGSIESKLTARPDQRYYDEISVNDIIDKRINGRAIVDTQSVLDNEFRKYVEGRKLTGVQGEYFLEKLPVTPVSLGTCIEEPGSTDGIYGYRLRVPYSSTNMVSNYLYDTNSMFRHRQTHNHRGGCIVTGSNGSVYVASGMLFPSYSNGFAYIEPGGSDPVAEVAKFNRLFPAGTTLNFYITKESSHEAQGYMCMCDLIGEPGKLDDRVKFIVTTGITQVVNLTAGDVILKGGFYYTALTDRIAVDLNLDVMTDLINWSDCGSNGAIGGYPAEWLTNGVAGVPNLSDSDNKLISLATHRVGTKGGYQIPLNATHRNNGYIVDKVLMIRNGVTTVIPSNPSFLSVITNGGVIEHYVSLYYNKLTINLTTTGTYDPILEAETTIQVFYRSLSRITDSTPTSYSDLHAMGEVYTSVYGSTSFGEVLYQSLLDKYQVSVDSQTNYTVSYQTPVLEHTVALNKLSIAHYTAPVTHAPIVAVQPISSAIKVLPTLVTNNKSGTSIGVLYKELKWDTPNVNQDGTPTSTLGDDGAFHQLTVGVVKDLNNNDIVTGMKYIPLRRFLK